MEAQCKQPKTSSAETLLTISLKARNSKFFVLLSEEAVLVYSQNNLGLSDQAMRCTLCV
jgi:hypothetical protein